MITFTSGGVKYTRTVIASHPDEVIIVHFSADKKGSISFVSAIDGRDDNYDKNEAYDDKTVLFTVSDGIPYACAITVRAKGGQCGTDANRLFCKDADEADIIIAAQSAWRTGDYEKRQLIRQRLPQESPMKSSLTAISPTTAHFLTDAALPSLLWAKALPSPQMSALRT